MLERVRRRYHTLRTRIRRIEYRKLRDVRRRLEETSTVVHLSLLLLLPVVIGFVTYLSNRLDALSFFLFPPLASGSYYLFTNPESKYASPTRFVAGLTAGAVCSLIAVKVAVVLIYPDLPPGALEVDAPGAAFAIFLTAMVTWALDIEEAAAFSTALLGLLIDSGQQTAFVLSVFLGSSMVAGVFYAWRNMFYENRAHYLYESTKGDDHVLVPMRGEHASATALLGARLAAAHDAGKVVLLDLVEAEWLASAERELLRDHGVTKLAYGPRWASGGQETQESPGGGAGVSSGGSTGPQQANGRDDAGNTTSDVARPGAEASTASGTEAGPIARGRDVSNGRKTAPVDPDQDTVDPDQDTVDPDQDTVDPEATTTVSASAARLEEQSRLIETRVGVPCEVVVAVTESNPAEAVLETARAANCDLIAVPYEEEYGSLTGFVRSLFSGDADVLVHRSYDGRTDWRRIMVPVRSASDVAHSMIDFATRLSGKTGRVSVCHCISSEHQQHPADEMLENLVQPFEGPLEIRVARADILQFLTTNAPEYDLVTMGASRDRSAASRLISPPTFERIHGLESDVAIIDRN